VITRARQAVQAVAVPRAGHPGPGRVDLHLPGVRVGGPEGRELARRHRIPGPVPRLIACAQGR